MEILVDTSALFALISTKDDAHDIAITTWENLIKLGRQLIINNYTLVECFTLLQNRLGVNSARYLQSEIIPFLTIAWIDEEQHTIAVQTTFAANRRRLSLVDCASFETMRRLGIHQVFTFDKHFAEQGFEVIPWPPE